MGCLVCDSYVMEEFSISINPSNASSKVIFSPLSLPPASIWLRTKAGASAKAPCPEAEFCATSAVPDSNKIASFSFAAVFCTRSSPSSVEPSVLLRRILSPNTIS